jgi:RNA polymerase sigma factor (sigma-70 family)
MLTMIVRRVGSVRETEQLIERRTDADLVHAVRNGDREAFGELYVRHRESAHRFACLLLGTDQGADDLVAEAFAKVLHRLAGGGGPHTAFRSYILTTVRTTLYKQVSADRLVDRTTELSTLSLGVSHDDTVLARFENTAASRAFHSLPGRWQLVLRYLEFEGLTTSVAAERLGMQANAVSALAFRARDALRLAYLQMHVNTDVAAECDESAANLAQWVCGRLKRSVRDRVRQHVGDCARCAGSVAELTDLAAQLGRWAVSPDRSRPAEEAPHDSRPGLPARAELTGPVRQPAVCGPRVAHER